ncbi:MAG TPA: glycosyltransferase [Planctomycetota bacterium]
MKVVDVQEPLGLDHYAFQPHLAPAVTQLRAVGASIEPLLRHRRVWMLNSSSHGGGVAEMLPKVIRLMRDVGVRAEWAVMQPSRPEFFVLTKRLHNLIHGVGDLRLGPADRELYEAVSRETADELKSLLTPRDVLIVHDPQPMGAGALLRKELGLTAIWRSHIGLEEETPETSAAWDFLRPYAEAYDYSIFSAAEYIPPLLSTRASVIHPGIDPASWKNREFPPTKLIGLLCNAGLAKPCHPVLRPDWKDPARRLRPDGAFTPASEGEDVGFGYRPTVLQVSRWDRLKGWAPLLRGFALLKRRARAGDPLRRRRLDLLRLVLAGPDPSSIQDDPEAVDALAELVSEYRGLAPELRADVALLALPMASRKENALMVNALQRCASLVVQNSIREGFGLTVTEAMWKRTPVLGTRALGLRLQIRDGIEGRINPAPEDPEAVAEILDQMLGEPAARESWGASAQRRVYDEFLVFTQVRRWLEVLGDLFARRAPAPSAALSAAPAPSP